MSTKTRDTKIRNTRTGGLRQVANNKRTGGVLYFELVVIV